MTEPTAKPSTEANSHQGTTATAKKEKNTDKKNVRDDLPTGKAMPKDNTAEIPDKAALLQLFTVADAKNTDDPSANEQPDTHTTASQPAVNESNVAAQRIALYHDQHERTRLLYMASANTRPTYLVQTLKSQFAE